MEVRQIQLSVKVYKSATELLAADAFLLEEARKVAEVAYAPYSQFLVGAAARLQNGQLVTGTNQENASYPVGICAERSLLSAAATLFPNMPIEVMAISYDNRRGESKHPISPCGACRQTLVEFEKRTQHPMRLILGGLMGEVYVIHAAKDLLPLTFTSDDL